MYNIEKYKKVLELDKILNILSEITCCEYARQKVLDIVPSTSLIYVKDSVEKTNDAYNLLSRYGSPSFLNIKDPSSSLQRSTIGGCLNISEILNVGKILSLSRILIEYFNQYSDKKSIDKIFNKLYNISSLEKKIFNSILSYDEISDDASLELSSIRSKIKQLYITSKQKLEEMVRSSHIQKMLQDSIITMRNGRYVLPVKSEHRGDIKGLVHDSSSTGSTIFIEPMSIVQINNKIKILLSEEEKEIERILLELSQECFSNHKTILNNFFSSIDINIIFSKAQLGYKMNGASPIINDKGIIDLKKARHPLLDKNIVVPVDISIGESYKGMIITGPNTGGKTVVLKTIGLFCLMVMCGLLLPVKDNSQISIFSNILVDIGDEQSIEQNLSTFSSHLTNIIKILNIADNKSLVIFDEIGSGTDPVEGSAIAISIIESLKQKGSTVLATTHYSEIKAYAIKSEDIENASCEFDIKTLSPTYKLIVGSPGKSNAFSISEKLGLSQDILSYAKKLVSSEDKMFENVIESLEISRIKYEKLYQDVEKKEKEIDTIKKEIEKLKKDSYNEKEKEILLGKEMAQKIIDEVKIEAEILTEEIKKINKLKNSNVIDINSSILKSQLKKIYDKSNPVIDKIDDNYILPRDVKIGDNLLVVDIDKKGIAISTVDKNGNIMVQLGIMKSKINIKNLRLLEQTKVQFNGSVTRTVRSKKDRKVSTELDLRGYTVEDGLMEVDSFLDNCLMTGVDVVSIIHGKGTGVLRTAVHRHLKSCKFIKSFRLGVFGEGESGVTILEIK
ncbi:MAG: endonuclease MutS2 [Oscillospiraceae bacterium]|nr:endonuclease MutS2 [Oscillospiraceae bacterium]